MTAIEITNGFLLDKKINTYIMNMNLKEWKNWGNNFFYINDESWQPKFSTQDIPMYLKWEKIKRTTLADKDDSIHTNTARHLFNWIHEFMKEIGLKDKVDLYANSIVLYWEGE